MKFKYFLAAMILAAVTLLGSCAGKGSGITLTVMGKKSDLEKNYMTSVFDMYESKTGNKIKLVAYEDSEFEARAAEDFKNGKGTDIFLHFHNADLNRFDVSGNFYVLNNETWADDLTDSAKAYCTDESGNLMGLPYWENSVSGCYYNKTVLDSLGLKPATTQAEFDVLCEVLAEAGYTPICWPANGCSWMMQFGLDPIFADDPEILRKLNDGEIGYGDIPEITNMVRWISDAADSGWFGSKYFDCGWSEISPAIASGEAVMTFIWDTWFYTDFESGNKYGVDDFALMPVFMDTVEGGTYEGGNLNMMMVNKNSEKLEAALDFLEFCATPENYNAAFDGISTVNCFKGQTTNIQSKMVTDAEASIAKYGRVSTAASRIIGYSADDVALIINEMLKKKISVEECVAKMDQSRLDEISAQRSDGNI